MFLGCVIAVNWWECMVGLYKWKASRRFGPMEVNFATNQEVLDVSAA